MKNSVLFLVGEFIVRGIPFLLLPIYISILSKEEFGKFSLYISLLPLLSIVFDLSQRISIKKFYYDYPKQILFFILYVYSFIFIMLAINIFFTNLLNITIIDNNSNFIILFVVFLYTLIEIYLSYLQISKQALEYNIIYICRNALPYILFVVLLYLLNNKSYHLMVYSQIILFFIIFIFIFFKITNYGIKFINILSNYKKYATYSLSISLPVLPVVASAYILSVSDRYMIKYFYSFKEVAVYSLAYNIAMIVQLVVMAVAKAWQPFIFENLKLKNYTKIKKYSLYYMLFVAIVSLAVWILDKWIVLFLSNEKYIEAVSLIPILLVGIYFFFLYSMLSNIVFYYKKMILFGLPALIAAIVNVVLNLLMLPKYGYEIATTTTMISYMIEFIVISVILLYLKKQIQKGAIR